MSEIKPKFVDGEPVCDPGECPYAKVESTEWITLVMCGVNRITTGMGKTCKMICIPGIRKQRDERPTQEEWIEAISIINAISKILRGDGDEVSQEMGEHEVVLQASQVWNALQEDNGEDECE